MLPQAVSTVVEFTMVLVLISNKVVYSCKLYL